MRPHQHKTVHGRTYVAPLLASLVLVGALPVHAPVPYCVVVCFDHVPSLGFVGVKLVHVRSSYSPLAGVHVHACAHTRVRVVARVRARAHAHARVRVRVVAPVRAPALVPRLLACFFLFLSALALDVYFFFRSLSSFSFCSALDFCCALACCCCSFVGDVEPLGACMLLFGSTFAL